MRASDLYETTLQGASTGSWLNYLRNMVKVDTLALGDNGERAKDLVLTTDSITKLTKLADRFEKEGEPKSMVREIEGTVITFTNGSEAKVSQVHKSPGLKAATSSEGQAIKYWNEGEVAETLLGAALYTRFLSKKDITADDVMKVMRDPNKFRTLGGGFAGRGKRGANTVALYALNKPLNNELINQYIHDQEGLRAKFKEGVKGLDKSLSACASYVNESQKVADAIKQADKHATEAGIVIRTDGVSDQKGTKADLKFTVGKTERLLSLKVNSVKQFGQTSGQSTDVIKTFFGTFVPDIDLGKLAKTDWPDMSRPAINKYRKDGTLDKMSEKVYKLTGEAYSLVKKKLDKEIKSNPEDVLKNLYLGIIHHVQGKAEKQTLVILNPDSKTAWKELEFGPDLEEALKSFKLEVTLNTAGEAGSSNHVIRVYGRPKDGKGVVAMTTKSPTPFDKKRAKTLDSKAEKYGATHPEMLFQLRSYIQNKSTQRNIVEMGPLLKSITAVEKMNPSVVPTKKTNTVSLANRLKKGKKR